MSKQYGNYINQTDRVPASVMFDVLAEDMKETMRGVPGIVAKAEFTYNVYFEEFEEETATIVRGWRSAWRCVMEERIAPVERIAEGG